MTHLSRACCFAIAAVVLSACGLIDRLPDPDPDLVVLYRSEGAGLGGGTDFSIVVVPTGKSAAFYMLASISTALDRFKAHVVEPDPLKLGTVADDVSWRSDVGLVPKPLIKLYNGSSPPRRLADAVFGVSFNGRYVLRDNKCEFWISARLWERGAGEAWKRINDQEFDGRFFVKLLVSDVNGLLFPARPAP
jgi:hypothetical protein